jgi:gamma-polyglutamate synthase
VVTGQATKPVLRAADRGQIRVREVHDLTGADTDAVMDVLDGLLRGRVVLGVGNLHGGGVELVDALEQRAITGPPSSAASHRGAA